MNYEPTPEEEYEKMRDQLISDFETDYQMSERDRIRLARLRKRNKIIAAIRERQQTDPQIRTKYVNNKIKMNPPESTDRIY